MRVYDLIEDNTNTIQEGDTFAIETEYLLLETYVLGFLSDGIVVAGDSTMLAYISTSDYSKTFTDLQLAVMEGGSALSEAEYHGHKVTLGKKMQGDVKKSKVYVKDPVTGNIKKVNFGDKTMRIKKSNPARRKSYRARHNCANPGPRTKANYWSCRSW